ncbi:MAG: TetR/AcrR family transcriptional regulator [bacterium]|nr:TetR/AcrR family transcriptional regulator [bacterium]
MLDKQRARNPEEKEHRKQSIVEALERLLERELHPLPSANDIAREAGVTKGVIYFYFNTREEIFLTLLLQIGERVFQRMLAAVQREPYDREHVKTELITACSTHPVFMQLGLLAPGILEANVSDGFIREFKVESGRQFENIAMAIAEHEDDIDIALCRKFFLRFYFLALYYWKHHHPPEAVVRAFQGDLPWILQGDLRSELSETFDWLWAGMRAAERSPQNADAAPAPKRKAAGSARK